MSIFVGLMVLQVFIYLYYLLQSVIKNRQEEERFQFWLDNPNLKIFFWNSPIYKKYYPTNPLSKECIIHGGMTLDEEKQFLEEMWAKHNARLKELHESKEKTLASSVSSSKETVRPKRKP